jgi:hypothetical protein
MPGMQILDNIDETMVSPSGGFGPVADDGYGVSYMIASDDQVIGVASSNPGSRFVTVLLFAQTFFHVSSKKSCKATVSRSTHRTHLRHRMSIHPDHKDCRCIFVGNG